jgi:hypothetical protein
VTNKEKNYKNFVHLLIMNNSLNIRLNYTVTPIVIKMFTLIRKQEFTNCLHNDHALGVKK